MTKMYISASSTAISKGCHRNYRLLSEIVLEINLLSSCSQYKTLSQNINWYIFESGMCAPPHFLLTFPPTYICLKRSDIIHADAKKETSGCIRRKSHSDLNRGQMVNLKQTNSQNGSCT